MTATVQDQAEEFWRKLLPELPDALLTRLAFNFGPVRRVIATDHERNLAGLINAAPGREAFSETVFGDIVLSDGASTALDPCPSLRALAPGTP